MTTAIPGRNDLGETFNVGDEVFSHYTFKVGVIGEPDASGWFRLDYVNGGSDLLDAARVCSLAHARRMGWSE